jgi:predicted acetyltransferase
MEIRGVETKAELEEVIDTYVRIFTQISRSGYYPFLKSYSKMIKTDPTYRMEQTRVIADGGRIVSAIRVADRDMRIGSAMVRLGGIADVYTRPEFRGRGYASTLMRDILKNYMVDRGYDITILYGVPGFYPQFGYATALPNYTTVIEVSKTKNVKKVGNLRRFRRDDLKALMDIHEADDSPSTGAVPRTKEYWLSKRRLIDNCHVLTDNRGKVVGYMGLSVNPRTVGFMGDASGEGGVSLFEVGVRGAKWCEGLLWGLAEKAKKANFETIIMRIPPDHIFAKYCYEACGSENRDNSTAFIASGGMVRIINLKQLFRKLEGELSRRIKQSEHKDWRGDLLIRTDMGSVKLVIDNGRVRIGSEGASSKNTLSLPQTVLARLVVGYNTINDAMFQPSIKVKSNMVGLIGALFPKGHPYLWSIDRF